MRAWCTPDGSCDVTTLTGDIGQSVLNAQLPMIQPMTAVTGGRVGPEPVCSVRAALGLGVAFQAGHFCLLGVQTMSCADPRAIRRHHDGMRPTQGQSRHRRHRQHHGGRGRNLCTGMLDRSRCDG